MTEEQVAAIRAELERVAASSGFSSAGRLAPFLRHLVEIALEGETGRLKEAVLGIEFFGRPADYDPRTDPIVRVEARRLRARLGEYYRTATPGTCQIALPKGGYVPVFGASEAQNGRRMSHFWRLALAAGVLALVAVIVWLAWRRERAAPPTVAVMPFANLSQDVADEYFSDGLSEELLDALGRIEGLRVVARSLTFQYKGKPFDVRQLGAQWGVSHVVEGSVRRGEGRVRVSVQVVNVADGYQLWAQTYDRPARDLFGIQEEVARAVAGALRVRLRRPARELFAGRYTENLDVYNRFLLARYYQNRYSRESLFRARDELQGLLQLEPRYAPAMAALSTLYALLGYYAELPPREAWEKGKDFARQAIAADPAMAEAYASLSATAAMNDWDWKACEENGRRALELDPSSAEARAFYGIACLAPQGKLAEAEQQLRQALELDPLLVFGNYTYAFTLLAQGKHELAAQRYRRTLDLKDDHPDIWWDYGMALGYAQRYQEAAAAFERNHALHEEGQRRPGAAELVFMGRPKEARERARQQAVAPREFRGWQMDLARDLALGGDVDAALDALDRAVAAHEPQAVWIKVDPRLAAVRSSPRYLELLRRIGL